MALSRTWLAPYSWEFVTAQNALLCQAKNALHKPTSDGHEAAFKEFCVSLDKKR